MARQIQIESPEPIGVNIDGRDWKIPGDLPMKEMNLLMSVMGKGKKGEEVEMDSEAFEFLVGFVEGLFLRHHSKEEVDEHLDLGVNQVIRLINLAYFPDEVLPGFSTGQASE